MTASPSRPWHCDEAVLSAFVDGSVDQISGISVETHLMTCAECRATVSRLSPQDLLERVWSEVREGVEAPPPGPVERLLIWLGVSAETARLLTAVPAMRGAWLLGLFSATGFAALATTVSDTLGMVTFLVIAPLVPMAGVAASFGGDADPAHELVSTAPFSELRLLLVRTAGVLVTSVPLAVVVGLALPGPSWLAIAWLSPAAAAVSLTLALGPLTGYTVSASVVAASWSAAVMGAVRLNDVLELIEPAMQLAFLVVAAVGIASIAFRYQSLGQTWRQS
jgi:hypothetical protein